MPKVSVIIPVYNVERYLPYCVDSVLAQTYVDWELLLIDDGSPDNSGAVCDRYAEKDRRITVVHKKNGGVSSARNIGLDYAKGEWVAFLDADDYLDVNTLKFLINTVESYPTVDVVDYPILRNAGSKDEKKLDTVDGIIVKSSIKEIDSYWFQHPRFECWGRLYKREKLEGIRFNTRLRIGEDTVFFMHYLVRCSTLVAIPDGLYSYCYRESSVMGSVQTDKLVSNDLMMLELMGEKVWERPILAAILYRMIIPKLLENKMKMREIAKYKKYLAKVGIWKLLSSSLQIKAKIIVSLLKLIVIVG